MSLPHHENQVAHSNFQKGEIMLRLTPLWLIEGFIGASYFQRAGETCSWCSQAVQVWLSPGSCPRAIRGRSKAAVAHVMMAWIRISSCMSTKFRSRPSIVLWRHSMTVRQGGK